VITHFDYIIAGAGCAGLSLLMRLLDNPVLSNKKILLTDRAPKNLDDRTWCYWEKGAGYFEDIVYHRWEELKVKHDKGEVALNMGGYAYKMIRGIDFYNYCFARIKKHPKVQVLYGEITAIEPETSRLTVNGVVYEAGQIFSSVLLRPPVIKKNEFYLLQHFRGWWIETDEALFDPAKADLMNFRVPQQHGCTFVYVMPVSANKALVEYTLFTEDTLKPEEYDASLKQFISLELNLKDYRITQVENGIIPMTNYRFPGQEGKVVYLGTAGGQTKASTGYTFHNIQKHSEAIAAALMNGHSTLQIKKPHPKFHFYDSVLLRVLKERKIEGADIFYRMFKQNHASRVLRFLDNESTFMEELAIMNSTPKMHFIPAAIAELT
jgi:lycopene beta-cyclase